MKNLRNGQSGIVTLVLIIVGIALAGYFIINSFLTSDEGQEIQDKASEVIETLDQTADKVKTVTD